MIWDSILLKGILKGSRKGPRKGPLNRVLGVTRPEALAVFKQRESELILPEEQDKRYYKGDFSGYRNDADMCVGVRMHMWFVYLCTCC